MGTALAVGGLATSIIGGISASSARKQAQKIAANQHSQEEAWYKRRYNEDYVDSAAGQRLVTMARDAAREHVKRAQGQAAVMGATDAATQIAKDNANKMVGDTIANIAAQDTARKDNIAAQQMESQRAYAAQQMQFENEKAANIANATAQAGNAMASIGVSLQGQPNNSISKEDVYNNVRTNVTSTLPQTDAAIRKDAASAFGR
ncbi:MAG: hypothetical protein K6D91_06090 [Prevotella sp.]|nr:hypothetical protein [Prevotella sp.]